MEAKKDTKTDKLAGTVVIADFAERRVREVLREEPNNETSNEALEPGTKLGRYMILERLGGGGMGVVYKAHDTELCRTVALKVLPPHLCVHPEYLNRFRAEAQANARLTSPNVVMLYSLLELPAGEVLVLEYCDGQTLEQRLKSGPLSPQEAVRIFDQALRAVEHIHSVGVVHRDLKPANIFLTRDGQVKLMDFGVAKIMDRVEQNSLRTMVGTLLYISPEQINGHLIDYRSDIYTLGISLFEAVTGRLPFERRTDYALMHAHVQEKPPRPRQFQRNIPPAFEWIIMKAIEKDPARRFQTATEFRRTLLKLGLVERRRRSLPKKVVLSRANIVGQQELVASRNSMRQWFGGLWFDTALIATVIGLVYSLGLYPITPSADLAKRPLPLVASAPEQTKVTPSVMPKHQASATPVAMQKTAAKTVNKYETLRQAWSD